MRILFILILLPLANAGAAPAYPEQLYCIGDDSHAVTMRLQVAKTLEQQAHGLMFRKEMKPFDGMLFDFGYEFYPRMWMKNTYMPLDMLFVDSSGMVKQIIRDTVPLSEAIILSEHAVTTVIELEAHRAEKEQFAADRTRVVAGSCPTRNRND